MIEDVLMLDDMMPDYLPFISIYQQFIAIFLQRTYIDSMITLSGCLFLLVLESAIALFTPSSQQTQCWKVRSSLAVLNPRHSDNLLSVSLFQHHTFTSIHPNT
jgi:hypothetical protein